MSERGEHPIRRRPEQGGELFGWLKDLFGQFALAWKLLRDRRVPVTVKMIPLLTALYILSPVDILPDWLLGVGQVDDLMILMVGLRMFISMSPSAIVAEYQRLTDREGGEGVWGGSDDDIIDLEAEVPQDREK